MRRTLAFILLSLFLLFLPSGPLRATPVERLALPWAFSLGDYELRAFPEKWLYKALHLWGSPDREEQMRRVNRYVELGGQQRRLEEQIQQTAANGTKSETLQQAQGELRGVLQERDDLRRGVEEFLESEISAVLREQGLHMQPLGVRLQFPPVDIRFTERPLVLIISPRDQVRRDADHLLQPRMTVQEMEELEAGIQEKFNLSALVEGIGGVATYPAAIPVTQDLRSTLQTALHEWLHHYLAFYPLGRSYGASGEKQTVNESLADLAGKELGDAVYVRLGGTIPPEPPPSTGGVQEEPEGFSFQREMRATRLRVDALLAEGKVDQAELYMEIRRQLFVEHGYFIRKLNQAYFAFHGTYADSPSSVSPVGGQLRALRQRYPTLAAFVKAVAQVGSYEEFEKLVGAG